MQLANAEFLGYVEWCKERIAQARHAVQLPPKPWAARDEVIAECSKKFKNPDLIAIGAAVDLAVLELWNRQKDDPGNFKKQTMLLRLKGIEQLVILAVSNGRKETFFKYVLIDDLPERQRDFARAQNQSPLGMVRMEVKEKVYTGTDMGAIHMLLSIERLIADLEGLYGQTDKASINVIQAFFEGLDNRSAKSDADEPEASSMAARAKNRSLTGPMQGSQLTTLKSIMMDSEPVGPAIQAKVVRRRGRRRNEAPPIDVKSRDEGEDDDADD